MAQDVGGAALIQIVIRAAAAASRDPWDLLIGMTAVGLAAVGPCLRFFDFFGPVLAALLLLLLLLLEADDDREPPAPRFGA